MIAVDTNIVVRIMAADDPRQAKRAVDLMEKSEIYISKTVLLETEWVLRHAYGIDANTIISGFHKLLGLPQVVMEDSWATFQALSWHEEGLDFADALHLASSLKAASFASFDKNLVKKSKKIEAVEVIEP
jgi:predicted nucleic-acid-binding protein